MFKSVSVSLIILFSVSSTFAAYVPVINGSAVVGRQVGNYPLAMDNLKSVPLFGMNKVVDKEIESISLDWKKLYICYIDGKYGRAQLFKVYDMNASSCEEVNEDKFLRFMSEQLDY